MTTPTNERTLILLRHAKAAQGHGKPDHDRELAPRGRRDARAVGQWLRDVSGAGVIDLVLCSTSERTRQTLDEVCAGGASVKETRFDERIFNASSTDLLEVLREVEDSVNTILMVGHGPGIPVLAIALAQDDTASGDVDQRWAQTFPTSGLAVLGFKGAWTDLAADTAYLRAFAVPRG